MVTRSNQGHLDVLCEVLCWRKSYPKEERQQEHEETAQVTSKSEWPHLAGEPETVRKSKASGWNPDDKESRLSTTFLKSFMKIWDSKGTLGYLLWPSYLKLQLPWTPECICEGLSAWCSGFWKIPWAYGCLVTSHNSNDLVTVNIKTHTAAWNTMVFTLEERCIYTQYTLNALRHP